MIPHAYRVLILLLGVLGTVLLSGIGVARGQGPALRWLVQAELPARPQGLAADRFGQLWLALQGDPPSLGVVVARACAEDGACEPREFPLPAGTGMPRFIAVDRGGTVWVTASGEDGAFILGFDQDTETFEQFAIPEEIATAPHDIAVDARGTVWFTDLGVGVISLDPERGAFVRQYETPEASLAPGDIAALGISIDPAGGVWCTCGTDLVRLGWRVIRGLRGGIVRDVLVEPIPDARKPHGVFAETATRAWVIDQHTATLHRYERGDHAFSSWPLPGAKFAVDPHWVVARGRTVYFTGFGGVLGTFDAARETFGVYVVSPTRQAEGVASGAFDLVIDRAGRVWLTEVNATALSRLAVRRFEAPPIPPPVPDF